LPSDVIVTIQNAAATFGVLSSTSYARPAITVKAWTDFELAYYRLAILTCPVTAETLENTKGTSKSSWDGELGGYDYGSASSSTGPTISTERSSWTRLGAGIKWLSDSLLGFSPAQRFARGLWLVAIGFAVFVVWAESYLFKLGQEANVTASVQSWKQLFEFLTPWAYGGLGSCAFLLRSAHTFIYDRSFDLRRKPEYFNRILLGAISGGTIILFMKYLLGEEGGAIQLSAAALGFVAGYSTDSLFNTIERIVAAIFPKVTETSPAASAEASLAELTPTPGPKPGPAEGGNGDKATSDGLIKPLLPR
jgi:hypothetical protein